MPCHCEVETGNHSLFFGLWLVFEVVGPRTLEPFILGPSSEGDNCDFGSRHRHYHASGLLSRHHTLTHLLRPSPPHPCISLSTNDPQVLPHCTLLHIKSPPQSCRNHCRQLPDEQAVKLALSFVVNNRLAGRPSAISLTAVIRAGEGASSSDVRPVMV